MEMNKLEVQWARNRKLEKLGYQKELNAIGVLYEAEATKANDISDEVFDEIVAAGQTVREKRHD